ncbi:MULTISPECIES: hypothetical protein [Virgibacillus]|uniref:Uncharacterized protein n=2 Tax=Virgibacillus TaxID=84406 RepID=A0A024QA62_9BACI|nr:MULTISPECIES: hypothetical protein [Virgibacillus]EQB37340.1 hypothetical protein M948_02025 [Virgibacillus sp. CM-4]GGJ62194.1 hypothetical protein GCM10007111_25380 [Virgibacillus kapii]CDQ39162.1 hypothetical protein BN990_01447 [Virgibacillus massiliensis]
MFVYMFLIGLLIGLAIYALTYLFVKAMDNKKRVLVVAIIGGLSLIGSLTVIGGFEGMPFGVLSLGILAISIVLALFGQSSLGKKLIYTIVILFIISYSALIYFNQVDYWIVKKTQYSGGDDFGSYTEQLQTDTTIQGYETFTISEGNKAVILSLGEEMAGNNIEVLDVEEYGNTTEIKIRTFYNNSVEANPVIAIGLNRVQSEIIITDTDGRIYEKATKDD